eukprot:1831645-Amphidinium_carterae.1
MPARPSVRSRPKRHRHNIGQADILDCPASDTHSTRHYLDQSPHPGCDIGRRHPNNAFPIR